MLVTSIVQINTTAMTSFTSDIPPDIVGWLNNNIDASGNLHDLDRRVADVLAAVEITTEETATQLDRTIDDISRYAPRLSYDLHFVRDAIQTLQGAQETVRLSSAASMPENLAMALTELRRLDITKQRMEAVKQVLVEAESWSTLEMDVTTLIAENSFNKAAQRLAEANASIMVFENTPEYDARKTLMLGLQNQLEASLSSALIVAINAHNLATCRSFFDIFSSIQREQEFRNYYSASRRASLVEFWANSFISDCDASSSEATSSISQTMESFLPAFYSNLVSLTQEERQSVQEVFPDPQSTLSSLVSSVLGALKPSLSLRLAGLVSYYGANALEHLIPLLHATESTAQDIRTVIHGLRVANPTRSPSEPTRRRRPNRMSISWRADSYPREAILPLSDTTDEWEQDLYQPFVEFQMDYSSLENRLLYNRTRVLVELGREDAPRQMRHHSGVLFGILEAAINRCNSFTHGFGAPGLLRAVDDILSSILISWRTAALDQLLSMDPIATSRDLSDLDYNAKDWASIQSTLHLLSSLRSFSERFSAFEKQMKIFVSSIIIVNVPSYIIQSTLNSAELQRLLAPGKSDSILMESSKSALATFALSCQSTLQSVLISPLLGYITSYWDLAVWREQPQTTTSRGSAPIPTFSRSPTEAIQRLAEGLLNLPRIFEVYAADDDGLSFSLETLPYFDILQNAPANETAPRHLRRLSVSPATLVTSPSEEETPVKTWTPEQVSSAWLSSLGSAVATHLLKEELTRIKSLTSVGIQQLTADLTYLVNILRALNVNDASLNRWLELLEMNDEDGRNLVGNRNAAGEEETVLLQAARLRRWVS